MNEHELTESSRVILMSSAVEYASRLVAVPSVSVNSNAAVSAVVESCLKELGFQTEVQEFLDPFGVTKVNVVGKLGAGTGGMAYFGHTDVVPVDSWSVTAHGPFEPTVRDDRLYGRGSCDMKGSVACMLAAAGRLRDKPLKQPLYIVCTADEEVGFHGARHLVENSPLYREIVHGQSRSIVGEPTELGVVHAHKGIAVFRAVSRGRAAHSSTREGTNANLAMIPFLAEMKQIHDETLVDPRWQHPEFDPPSICWNIGINDHTPAVNITAPQSICTVNFRHMPGQDANELVERARRAAEKCDIEFHLESIGQPLYIDSKSDYVREVVEQVGATSSRTVGYGTDGSQFTELKQIVVLGPGSIRQAHTDDEWISLEQLQRGTDVYERLARRWCQQ